MPIDLSAFGESLQRGLGAVPPIAIGLVLLAGPTAALIGYRWMSVAGRRHNLLDVAAPPLWVCHGCRSVNELRSSRCYHCHAERDAAGELELIADQPGRQPATLVVPAGSPFAATGVPATGAAADRRDHGPGVPVMAGPSLGREPVAMGSGQAAPAGALTSTVEHRP